MAFADQLDKPSPDWKGHNTRVLRKAKPGDIIEFVRVLFRHVAIYVGEGKVIHLTGDSDYSTSITSHSASLASVSSGAAKKACVREDDFWDVAKTSNANINNSVDSKYRPLLPKQIVENARKRLGEAEYNVITDNCETFVNECRYGVSISDQVDDVVRAVTYLVASAVSKVPQ